MKYQQIQNDLKDIEEIINNPDHIVRIYYRAYLDGNYGQELYEKYSNLRSRANSEKQKRSFVIQSFCDYNSLDYGLTRSQVQGWLMTNIGIEKLEELNRELISDAEHAYTI